MPVGRCWAAIECVGPVSVLDSGCKLLDGEEADGGCYGMICEMLRQEGECQPSLSACVHILRYWHSTTTDAVPLAVVLVSRSKSWCSS